MEPGGRTSEEIAKYSFLLGSALRNEDADQFLQIYDAIVPKDLEENEVEEIKFKSRQIADLAEEEYNTLVIDRVRDFSLATSVVSESAAGQGLAMSKSHGMMRSGTDQKSQVNDVYSSLEDDYKRKYLNDTEEENVSSVRNKKPSMQSLSRTSRHFVTKPDAMETEEADSGVFNTSKQTGSSISDPEFADDSESRGDFDYYPEPYARTRTREQELKVQKAKQVFVSKSEMKRKNEMAFDGAYEADSDQEDFRFPRDYDRGDPLAEGTELKTFNITEYTGVGTNTGGTIYPFTDYRNSGLDSGDELCEVICDGQRPSISDYNREQKDKNTRQYDEAVNADSDEMDDTDTLENVSVHERLYSGHIPYARMRPEEEEEYIYDPESGSKSHLNESKLEFRSGSFQKASQFRRHLASDHKNVDDKVSFQLTGTGNNNKPPFSFPLDNQKINESVEKLLPTPGKPIGDVKNMPHATRINKQNSDGDTKETEQSDINKKKKKKKKTNREEGKDSIDRSTDENGNPVEGRDISSRKDTKSSSQDNERSIFPSKTGHFDNFYPRKDTNEMQGVDKNDKLEEKKKRRQKKKKSEETTIHARNIPGNIGDENIDKLMNFIENSDCKKKKVNGSQHNGLPDKNGKKNTKKQHKNHQSSQKEEKTVSSESNSEINYDMKSNTDTGNDTGKNETLKDKDDTTDLTCKDSVASSESSCDTEDKERQVNHISGVQSQSEVPVNDFIHTDIDPPVEEEFKVVSKTKKKKKSQANSISQRDSYKDHSLNIPKEEHRSRRPKRSVTPPPISSATQDIKRKDGTFSPTAFPALGVKPREGRRHSAGSAVEVCQAESKTEHDDSDLESVKSMPAAGVGSSGNLKNNFDVSYSPSSGGLTAQLRSYATAAASPKVKASSSGVQIHISSSNSEDIGPSVSKTDSDNSTESMPVNLIGQEDFPPVSVNPVRDPTHLNSNNGVKDSSHSKGEGRKGSDTNNASDLSKACRNLGKDLTNISKNVANEFPSKTEAKNKHISSRQTLHVETQSSETVDSVKDKPCSNASKSSLERSTSVNSIATGSSIKDDKKTCSTSSNNPTQQSMTYTSRVSSTTPSSTPNVSKSATNQTSKKNKVQTKQSVIFLDKRMNDNSGKLDITFGFDSDSFVDSCHVPGQEISFLDCANLESPNSESIMVLNKDMPTAQENNVIKKCLGMNGISVPISSQGNSVVIPDTSNRNRTHTEESVPRGGTVEVSTEKYQFGDVNQALYNKKDDPNYQRGNFNAEDAISFVYRAWESVIALKEKDPQKVMVYSED